MEFITASAPRSIYPDYASMNFGKRLDEYDYRANDVACNELPGNGKHLHPLFMVWKK